MIIHKWLECDIGDSDICDIVNVMVCGKVISGYDNSSTTDNAEVTCKECLSRMKQEGI